jgi:stage IV sporulation protein B
LANKNEVKTGSAQIITTIQNGKQEAFNIEIERIDYASDENKNLIIKVIDENLISKTGGIIQGMSGSPIIQEGKLIGAVTHVFLNDPTGGYGIFAETMLNTANELNTLEKAS